jgi:hypothetical protein
MAGRTGTENQLVLISVSFVFLLLYPSYSWCLLFLVAVAGRAGLSQASGVCHWPTKYDRRVPDGKKPQLQYEPERVSPFQGCAVYLCAPGACAPGY